MRCNMTTQEAHEPAKNDSNGEDILIPIYYYNDANCIIISPNNVQ